MIALPYGTNSATNRKMPEVKAIYPNGIHAAIAEFLSKNEDRPSAPPRWTSRSTA